MIFIRSYTQKVYKASYNIIQKYTIQCQDKGIFTVTAKS